jgi:TAP C-terminal domain
MIIFTLTGVYKEPDAKGTAVRHFFRKFILVPNGAGFSIVNDMLFVTNATPKQVKQCFTSTPAVSTSAADPAAGLAAKQFELIQSLSAQSGMNALWSKKCVDKLFFFTTRLFNGTRFSASGCG